MKRFSFCCTLIVVAGLTSAARADDWPFWRGPENNGISKEKGLATSWSETKNIAWKLTLPGKGASTPIVWKDRIFLTGVENGAVELWCVNRDGKMLWKSPIGPVARNAVRKDEGNDASATASTDGKHVFAYAGSGDFAAFDFDGKQVWKFNAQTRYGKFSIQHGMHVTPLLHDDRLYLTLLTNGGHWVVALDKTTGNEIWKIARKSDAKGESREAYTSPVVWQNGKDLNLVVLGCDYTTGHQLKDGKEVWRLGDLNLKNSTAHRIIASPLATSEELIVPTCRGLVVVALRQGASGFIKTGSSAEQWRIAKGSPDVPSPLVHDGLLYLMRENGVLICMDVKTGEQLYEERLTAERYRGSPVYADGKIYAVGRDSGTFSVVKAGRKFQLLATNRLADEFPSSPAISQGRIYLRGFHTLYAIQEK